MRSLFLSLFATFLFFSCTSQSKPQPAPSIDEQKAALATFIDSLRTQLSQGADEDSIDQVYTLYLHNLAQRNAGNEFGLEIVRELAYDMSAAQLDSVRNLCDLYRADEKLRLFAEAKQSAENTAPGQPYVDVAGINVATGKAQSLSDILALGKPVIVDFWASWCGPCKREISQYLSQYAQQYKSRCSFVSIAVWENSIDDTRQAMAQLPISWPVIFAGDRNDSPASAYGILGIPHILLIAPDGTILARDLRGEAIAQAIEKL